MTLQLINTDQVFVSIMSPENSAIRRKGRYASPLPSRVLLMLVRGSLESLISRTTFVRLRKAGSMRVNFIMCPGNHDGGVGSGGR
jgi:hypothetical protein